VEASKEVAKGNLNINIKLKSSDEIGILIDEFNNMVKELKNLYIKLERSNRELKINQEYLEAVLENARTGVIYSDKTGKIKKINKAAENILGINRDKLKDKDISELLNILGLSLNQLETEKTIEIKGKVIIVKATNIIGKGLVLVFDDITDVVIAEKARTWREIAQRIAHEIKNPLTPIKLAAERIERQYKKQNENFPQILEKSVKAIYSEVEHLSKLVKDFRQFAMNDKLDIKEFNLKTLFEELKRSYQTDKFSININVPDNITIKADYKLLRQAFSNIIQNSFELLKDGGSISIEVKDLKNHIKILFKDTGKGISEEEIEKIFVPYYSKKPKGSGLGLTITKEIPFPVSLNNIFM
jgi:two-component system nitrogen regulation sensor histidine kinase NtrY